MTLELQWKRATKVAAALRHPGYRRALRHRVLPAVEHQPVLASLGELAALVDVGANVGQFSTVARRLFPDATILALEPLPEAAAAIRQLFAGDPRFECLQVAASDASGQQAFHVTGAADSSSLLPPADRQVAEFPETEGVATLSVSTASLDEVVRARDLPAGPLLVKVDTQGSELAVLRGATELLGRARHLIVEASFVELYRGQSSAAEITEHLITSGWRLSAVYDVKSSRLTGEPIQADFLYQRDL